MGRLVRTTKYLHGDEEDEATLNRLGDDIRDMVATAGPEEIVRVTVDYVEEDSPWSPIASKEERHT